MKPRKWQAKFRNSIVGAVFCGARRRGRGPWRFRTDLPHALYRALGVEHKPGSPHIYYTPGCPGMSELIGKYAGQPNTTYRVWRGWLLVDVVIDE